MMIELVGRVKRSSMMFDGMSDEAVAALILDAIEEIAGKGVPITLTSAPTWQDIDIINPAPNATMRSIIVLQTKVLALNGNPLVVLDITGLRQVFNVAQAAAEENRLDRMITDYAMEQFPGLYTMTEYDVLGDPGIKIRTLKSLIFPSYPKLN
jgi:hypothetical protein